MPSNSAPYEIIAGSGVLWIAAYGTAFPDVDETPSGSWAKVGTDGDLNISEDGVTISHGKQYAKYRASGDTGVRKNFLTEQDLTVSLMINDLSLEQYKHALNGNAITTVAASSGVPGTKKIGLTSTPIPTTYALMLRIPSPYGDNMTAQWEWPRAQEVGNPQPKMVKGVPAGLALEFSILVDPSASTEAERFGRFVAQTAAAT